MDYTKLQYDKLIELVRISNDNEAFKEIIKRLHNQIWYCVNRTVIKGYDEDDLYQEALIAITRAIQYDTGKSPFEAFAFLVIRRHFGRLMESAQTLKRSFLNNSLSLEYDYGEEYEYLKESLTSSKRSLLDNFEKKEYYNLLFGRLYNMLSDCEREVFLLRSQNRSYIEIAKRMNKTRKHIDGAMCRIRQKAKVALLEHNKEYLQCL